MRGLSASQAITLFPPAPRWSFPHVPSTSSLITPPVFGIAKGVLGRAEWVRQDLEDQGHLASLLGPRELSNSARRHRCRGYSLRITGHSLGGSTGVLLTYMLRSTYPSTRCISISPLGGLLNAPFADDCKEFVLSAALGEDVVPRLSVTAMERMRDSVLELIARSKVHN